MTRQEGLAQALKVVHGGSDGIAVLAGHERRPPPRPAPEPTSGLPDGLLDHVLAAPTVRDEAVARARTLLQSASWCRADEVAAELVDCYVARRLP